MKQSSLEASFAFYWRVLHPQLPLPQTEYPGIEGRQFLFDFAWPESKVAVECQGGTWAEGQKRGHTRGSMYEKDCEKLALAMAQGWTVFYLTTTMLNGKHAKPVRWLGLIADAIGGK